MGVWRDEVGGFDGVISSSSGGFGFSSGCITSCWDYWTI